MYVYIWKDASGIPFYVGCTKNIRRTNPRNTGGRNWLCRAKIEAVGLENIIVEFREAVDASAGAALETELIAQFGRVQLGTGTLTNLRSGGEGLSTLSAEHREKLRVLMLSPTHPIRSAASRERQRQRMNDADIKAKFIGDANPAKRQEVRDKIKAVWSTPEHRARMRAATTGLKRELPEQTKQKLRENLENNAAMLGWGARNGKDPAFDAKRIAGIRAAQTKRAEKMSDPVAKALRIARLKATLAAKKKSAAT